MRSPGSAVLKLLDRARASATLTRLTDALVTRSSVQYRGWGDVVLFAASTPPASARSPAAASATSIPIAGSGPFARQTTQSPGGLADRDKGKRARLVPLTAEVRDVVRRRLDDGRERPDGRLFTGPRGGRIATAVLRDATQWDAVVAGLGLEHLRRHDLRHTGLTWMADARVVPSPRRCRS